MRLSKDAEKLSLVLLSPELIETGFRLGVYCFRTWVMLTVPPQTPVCVSGPLELLSRRRKTGRIRGLMSNGH